MEINEKISIFFKTIGVSQKEIAQAQNVEPATVSQWFGGKRAIPLSLVVWAVDVHKLDPSTLFEQDLPKQIVSDARHEYVSKQDKIENILKDFEKVLKKHL